MTVKQQGQRFLSRTPVTVTAESVEAWSNARKRIRGQNDFGCLLCGHLFKAGDTIRWIYANLSGSPFKYGNFHVCSKCDGLDADVLKRAAEQITTINRVMMTRLCR